MSKVRFHPKINKKYTYDKIIWTETHNACSRCEDYYPAEPVERLVEAARRASAWIEPDDHSNPQRDAIYRKLKAALEPFKGDKND